MKTSGRRIGLTVFVVTAVSFAVVSLLVQGFLYQYMRHLAIDTLEKYAGYARSDWKDFEEDDSDLFTVLWLDLERGKHRSIRGPRYDDEKGIREWYESQREALDDQKGALRIEIGERCYFVTEAIQPHTDEPAIFYVDFSAAEKMLFITRWALLAATAVCTAIAAILGVHMGRQVRKEQEAQRVFFENASHELKTPLMSIQGFTEGLQDGVISDRQHAYDVIMRQSQKMTRMVDEILYLSRYDRGLAERHIEPVSIAELTGDCLDALEQEIRRHQLRIETDIADRFIQADEEQMRRAISNILSNAVRYAHSEIRIQFHQDTLSIWDDGDPLPPEALEQLFERFFKGPNGNTGIGLALARQIVEAHGGHLKAENADGGVRFVIDCSGF